MIKHEIDARGLLCPLPVIKVQNKIKTMQPGDTLEILCTDPGTQQDIPSWCRIYGHELLEEETRKEDIRFLIRRSQ